MLYIISLFSICCVCVCVCVGGRVSLLSRCTLCVWHFVTLWSKTYLKASQVLLPAHIQHGTETVKASWLQVNFINPVASHQVHKTPFILTTKLYGGKPFCLASEEISHLLWNLKVYYHTYKSPSVYCWVEKTSLWSLKDSQLAVSGTNAFNLYFGSVWLSYPN
jgi:hypothetical protein